MDDQLLLYLYHLLFNDATFAPLARRPAGCTYPDAIVVLVYFLTVVRGRSPCWASAKANWPLWMRRLDCPGYSQLSRRLKSASVRQLIERINQHLRQRLPRSTQKLCDGKPLLVGGFSKDSDSAWGVLPGDGWGRGYKVHVLCDESCGAVDAFAVTALDRGEPTVMRRLVLGTRNLDLQGNTLRGDSNYDSNRLYRAVAQRGGRLIAPRKKPFTGIGHHPQHPDRLRAISELEGVPNPREALRQHARHRVRVEQGLALLTNLPFGLAPLPNFVRRQQRVQRWVLAKITLYHLYLSLRHQQKLAA